MITKFLKLALSQIARGNQESALELVRNEVSAMGFRMLAGAALTVTIIYSVVQTGRALQTLLGQFENGLFIELATFGSVAVACIVILYLLFHQRSRRATYGDLNTETLLARFFEGIDTGFSVARSADLNSNSGEVQFAAQSGDMPLGTSAPPLSHS